MSTEKKREKRRDVRKISALCLAVKTVRTAGAEPQQRFAEQLGVSLVSVNRWEQGHQEPRDARVLASLLDLARARGQTNEAELFARELKNCLSLNLRTTGLDLESPDLHSLIWGNLHQRWNRYSAPGNRYSAPAKIERMQQSLPALREWRLRTAARLAALSSPAIFGEMEKAAAPLLDLIDQRLNNVDEDKLPEFDFAAFEDALKIAVQQYTLTKTKSGKDK